MIVTISLSVFIFLIIKDICNNMKTAKSERRVVPGVIKFFSCSTQLNMKFFLLINVKMPTIVGILTFMSGKNSILDLPETTKSRIS